MQPDIDQVLSDIGVDDTWDVISICGGITLCFNQALTTSLVCFAPRPIDGTVNIVKISKSYYVRYIKRAISQFL